MASEIFVGSVSVGVVPNARNWNNDLRRQLIPEANQVGNEYGRKLSSGIVNEMGRKRADMAKEGERSGGAFSDMFRKRVEAAFKALPKLKPGADTSEADRALQAIRARMEELSKKHIGVDLSTKDAMAQLKVLEEEIKIVEKQSKSIDVRFNTAEARAQLALLERSANDVGDNMGRGLFQNMMGGITSAAMAAGGTGAQGGGGLGSLIAGNPALAATAGALGLLALPFIAQAVSGLVVAAFGGMLAGMAVLGAAQDPVVSSAFTNLKDRAMENFQIIGMAWVPVIESILNTTRQVFDQLTPVFTNAAGIIAGPFRNFADTLVRAFTQPQVVSSIQAVASAFADILNALAPDLPGMIASLADSVERIAHAVSKNPKAFADFINFIVQIVIFAFNALAVLTNLANYMITTFVNNIHGMAHAWDVVKETFDRVWGWIKAQWRLGGQQLASDWDRFIVKPFHRFIDGAKIAWNIFLGGIKTAATTVWNAIKTAWQTIWDALKGAFRTFVMGIINTLGTIVHGAAVAFGWIPGLGGKLKTADQQFQQFAQSVNQSLGGINNKQVTVGVKLTPIGVGPYAGKPVARGGHITGPGGPTDDLAGLYALSNDEWVIRASSARRYGHAAMSAVNEGRAYIGYARGGQIKGLAGGGVAEPGITMATAIPSQKYIDSVIQNRLQDLVNKSFVGTGLGILQYAMQFLHKVPYVWGGDTPAGWDCSGFVSYVFRQFHIMTGRMVAEGFRQWAKPSGAVPGAMAFYGNPAHHVGFVVDGNTLLSALGHAYGTTLSSLNLGDNSGYGVPPSGYGISGQAAGAAMSSGFWVNVGREMAARYGWVGAEFDALNQLWTHESGWNPWAVNPNGGAYNIPQIYPPAWGHPVALGDGYGGIAWGLNYIKGTYGDPINAWQSWQSSGGRGYDQGGWLPPGITVAVNNTGSPELIIPAHKLRTRGGDGAVVAYHAHFDGLTGAAIESHVQTAFMTMSLTDGALQRQGRRSLCQCRRRHCRLTILIRTDSTGT